MKKIVSVCILSVILVVFPILQVKSITCGCTEGMTGYSWEVQGENCSATTKGGLATRINYVTDDDGRISRKYETVAVEVATKFCL